MGSRTQGGVVLQSENLMSTSNLWVADTTRTALVCHAFIDGAMMFCLKNPAFFWVSCHRVTGTSFTRWINLLLRLLCVGHLAASLHPSYSLIWVTTNQLWAYRSWWTELYLVETEHLQSFDLVLLKYKAAFYHPVMNKTEGQENIFHSVYERSTVKACKRQCTTTVAKSEREVWFSELCWIGGISLVGQLAWK